ncbi:MAG: hypothetical protein WC678_05155 [Parcubacteria group bacterium]|jgi:hypothetical protein
MLQLLYKKELDIKKMKGFEITPGFSKDLYANKKDNDNVIKKVLESEGGLSINGENITPMDPFYIPEGLNSEEKLDIIAKDLCIERKDLAKKLPGISKSWQESKRFLTEHLLPEEYNLRILPREIQNVTGFKSLKELEEVFSKTTRIKKTNGLGLSPYYCALAKLTIATNEYYTEEFEGLKNESAYLVSQFFQECKNGTNHFHFARKAEEEWSHVGILLSDSSWMNAKLSFRGKTKESVIMKLASKPEISAKEMIKDGIGLRFEVDNVNEAKKLFIFLSEFLPNNFDTKKLIFENTNLIDETDSDFFDELKEKNVAFLQEENPSTHKDFSSAKLRGAIKVPQNGKRDNMMLYRNFEIQVVPTDSKNETGLVQSTIYKRIQKLSLFTRLFGSFDEKFLDAMCQEASNITKIAKEKIKTYIKERSLARVSSSISKNIKYITFDHFSRWEKAGLIPKEFTINKNDRKRFEEKEK